MKIVFRAEAAADLHSIIAYYEEVAPEALTSILSDIHRSIDRLAHFPRIGMKVPERPFRRLVKRRYHFKVADVIAENAILILGISGIRIARSDYPNRNPLTAQPNTWSR